MSQSDPCLPVANPRQTFSISIATRSTDITPESITIDDSGSTILTAVLDAITSTDALDLDQPSLVIPAVGITYESPSVLPVLTPSS